MKIIRSILMIIFMLFCLLLAIVLIAFKSGVFTEDVRDYVQAEIMKNTGKSVRIGKIELGFINNIVLKDVEVPLKRTFNGEKPFIFVKGIIFRFNLIDLILNKKEVDKTLSHVIIDSPEIDLKKKNGKFNVSDFTESFTINSGEKSGKGTAIPAIIPVTRVLIEGGKINYEDTDKKFYTEISGLKGSLSLGIKSRKINAYLAGKTRFSARRNIRIDGEYSLDPGSFKAGIEVKNADLNHWAGYAVPMEGLKIKKGDFSFNVDVNGKKFSPEKMRMQGGFVINGGDVLLSGVPLNDINVDLTLIRDRVHINDINFRLYEGSGIIKGGIKDIFTKPAYDADLMIKDINMAAVNKKLFAGNVKAYFRAKGSAKKPDMSGGIQWETGSIRDMRVKNVEAQVRIDDTQVFISGLKGIIGEGELSGAGKAGLSGKQKLDIKIGLDGVNVQKAAGVYEMAGRADLKTKIFGTISNPVIRVEAKSGKVSWKGNDINKLSANVVMGKKGVIGHAAFGYKLFSSLSLDAKIMDLKDSINIEYIKLSEEEKQLVKITGAYIKNEKQVDVTAGLKDIKISKLALDFLKDKDVDGDLNGTVGIKGDPKKPVFSAEITMDPLRIKGEDNNFGIKIDFENNLVRVNEIIFNDNLKGSGEFSLKKKIFTVNMQINRFRGSILKEFTGLEIFDNSTIDGTVLVKKEDDGFGGSIVIDSVYGNSVYKGVNIDITGEKNEFVINKVFIRQNKGYLRTGGAFSVKKDEDIILTLDGMLRDYRVNGKLTSVDGDFYHDSKITITEKHTTSANRFKASGIKFNGKKMDDLEINLKTVNSSVPDFSLRWGDAYEASGKVFDADVPEVEFALRLKDADLFPLYALSESRKQGLPADSLISGRIEVKGKVNNSLVSAAIRQAEGAVNLHGDISLIKNKGVYTPHRLNLKYMLSDADLNKFMRIFDEKFGETGKVSGSGLVRGRLDNPEAEGEISMKDGVLAGFDYDNIGMDFSMKDRKVKINSFRLDYKNQMLKVFDSEVEIKKDSYYATIKSQMDNFVWRGNFLTGGLNFYGRISNYKGVKIDGSLSSEDFKFKFHRFKPFLIKVNYDNDGLVLKSRKGESDIDASIGFTDEKIVFNKVEVSDAARGKYFDIKGYINKNKGDSDMRINGTGLDPQMINDLMGWEHKWGGSLNGNVKISGNPNDGLKYTILVSIQNGMVNDIPYDLFSGLFILKDNWLDFSPVDPLILVKDGKYEVKLTGVIPVPMSEDGVEKTKGASMDLHATLKDGDLSIINFLKFIDEAEGPVNADLHITGTKEYPTVNGTFSISGGNARMKYLFRELKNIYGNIIIKDNVMDIYSLKGDTEKGTLKIENLDKVKKGGYLKWYKPYEVNWRMTNIGDKLHLSDTRFMEYLEGDVDINLEVTGLLAAPSVKGTITASDLRYRYPVKMMNEEGEQAVSTKDNYAKKINWDIKVFGGDNVYYYNDYYSNYAQVYLKWGENPLVIQGKGSDLKIYGTIMLTRGTYKYLNTEFSVDDTKESKVVFDGMSKPILDVYATTTKRRIELASSTKTGLAGTVDLDVLLHVWGRVGNTKIDISSDPALERNRLIYILTLGRDLDPNEGIGQKDLRKMADAIANSWIKQGMEKIKQYTPFDVLDIKVSDLVPQDDNQGDNGNTANAKDDRTAKLEVGVGKYLTENIYFGYNLRLMEEKALGGLFPEQEVGAEISLDEAMKLVTKGIFRSADDPYLVPFEGFAGIEWRKSFGTWGEKEKPTPGIPKVEKGE